MLVDLSSTGPRGIIDVTNAEELHIQAQPGGTIGSAVLEMRRAFSTDPTSPTVSLGANVDLAGGVTTVDVTDTAYIRLYCATAQSGASCEVQSRATGDITGRVFEQGVDLTAVGPRPAWATQGGDDTAQVIASTPLANSAVLAARRAQGAGFEPDDFGTPVTIALDGTVTEVPVSSAGFVVPVCTTAQSDQRATLYWYVRSSVVESGGGSTPTWENAVCLDFEESGNVSTGTSSGFQYSVGNGDVGDFGTVVPFDFEIIGIGVCFLTQPAGTTATVEVYKGSGLSASSGTGVSVTVPDNDGAAYTDATSSPVNGNAGEWVVPVTTAKTGGSNIGGARVSVWVRPR
jgi:hypothetical protein